MLRIHRAVPTVLTSVVLLAGAAAPGSAEPTPVPDATASESAPSSAPDETPADAPAAEVPPTRAPAAPPAQPAETETANTASTATPSVGRSTATPTKPAEHRSAERADDPRAQDDTFVILRGETSVTVPAPGFLANDPTGSVVQSLDVPSGLSVTHDGNGGFTYVNHDSGALDSGGQFTYTTQFGTARVTLVERHPGPIARDDSFTTPYRTELSVNMLANDEDFGTAILVALSEPSHGTFGDDWTYTPNPGFVGTDSFTYYLQAIPPYADSRIATVTIEVTPGPQPTARDDEYVLAADDQLQVGALGVLGNDTTTVDPEVLRTGDVTHGTLDLAPDGTFSYRPDDGFVGVDSFTYRVTDAGASDTATVTLRVTPAARDDAYAVAIGRSLSVEAEQGVLHNDVAGTTPLVSLRRDVEHGDLTLEPDGSFVYTPDPGFVGEDDFSYAVHHDGAGWSQEARVAIEVLQGEPVLEPDAYTLTRGEVLEVAAPGPLANDSLPAGTLWRLAGCSAESVLSVTCTADGALRVEADDDFLGTATIAYTVESDRSAGTLSSRRLRPTAAAVGVITIQVVPPEQTAPGGPDDTETSAGTDSGTGPGTGETPGSATGSDPAVSPSTRASRGGTVLPSTGASLTLPWCVLGLSLLAGGAAALRSQRSTRRRTPG